MAENTTKVEEKQTKFLKQEEYTHKPTGIKYVFSFPGTKRVQEILDESKGLNGHVMDSIYNEKIMKEVIASPQTNWDYWDENDGYREVMAEADRFLGKLL